MINFSARLNDTVELEHMTHIRAFFILNRAFDHNALSKQFQVGVNFVF